MIIDNFYKNFKVRDYMEEDIEIRNMPGEFIDCSLGTNPFIDKNILENYVDNSKNGCNKYVFGCYYGLKKTLLNFWNKNLCQDFSEEEIGFGSGSMGIIRNLCTFLLDEGDYVLGVAPQFPRFVSEVELRKARYEYYCLDTKNNFKFDVAEFISKISAKYKGIHLENPNNPTGQIIDIKDIEAVVKVAKENGSIVVVDEAYGDYMDLKNSSISLVKKYDNLVVFRSGSKFWGLPNHRVGYVFANKEIMKVYNVISLPFPFSDYSCMVFENVLKDYESFSNTKKFVVDTKKKIFNSLNKENYLCTDFETPIFTVRSDKHKNLYKALLNNGLISEPCNIFLNLDEKFARIRINKDYEKIVEVLKKVL